MKRLFFAMALVLCAATVSAQVVVTEKVVAVEKQLPAKKAWAGYETNRFWDNWEIGAAGGVQMLGIRGVFGQDDNGEFMDHFNWQADLNFTKWVHPVLGLRLQLQGGQYQNKTATHLYMDNPYIFTHLDVMVNLSNWIGKERDDRLYYAIVFGGFGYHVSGFTKTFRDDWGAHTDNAFALTAGLLNKFRVTRALDIELELKTWTLPSNNFPAVISAGDRAAVAWSATVGVAYRFNKRGWKQASPYTFEDIMMYQEEVAQRDLALANERAKEKKLADELAATKKALADANAKAPGEGILVGEESVTIFNIGSAHLTAQDKTRLDIVANEIKNAPKGKVFRIEGHADAQTGNHESNLKLSQERAKNVYDYLISKGVKKENLTYKGLGDKSAPFKTAAENRDVVIR